MGLKSKKADKQPVSPLVVNVGNAFVQQYYHILRHSPGLVHQFYKETSKLGRPENDGTMSITTSKKDIDAKIVSLNYGDLNTKINSVDAHESFYGGVDILVTGCMTGKDNTERFFAQSFFLAPQDNGYYILNDMFRFVDNTCVNPVMVAWLAVQQPVVSSQDVGNAFVQQYYHILHLSPGLVHQFYQETSKLTRPEKDGSMSTTTTVQAIDAKIVSLNYGDFKAEIKSVDTQESFMNGMDLLVTGYLTGKDNTVRNFAQSFFLAPQDKGYYVLNDMFRFVDSTCANPVVVVWLAESEVVLPGSDEPETVASAPIPAAEEVYNPGPDNGDVPVVESEELPVAEVFEEVQDDTQLIVPKKSYASIENRVSAQSAPVAKEVVVRGDYNPPDNVDVSVVGVKEVPVTEVVDDWVFVLAP